ncbi:hypothetical protein A9P82_02485 [Arachidicoccus ginsenosidimutans]|uniref:DUF5677 domain-containing protein n=1 Tax=Arachidicoccus sp. BS20 TaxID=1850526 RepID=UPI0007F16C6B|nr:DUF5677 domain-containing protein [Arachidicoccus sp. BS20]ANI88269.1 hypothetical protein A9P82_02485 [Arachidicoccus sp. BS20]
MSFENLQKQIADTEEYTKFSVEFDYFIDFFNDFSELVSYNGRIISLIVDSNVYTLDTTLLDSSVQTLRSIKLCCSIGSFADANTLMRKLRDELILYVYMLNIINLRKPFIEDDLKKDFNVKNAADFLELFSNLRFNNVISEDEQAVSAWLNNTVNELPRPIKKKLEFENYMKVLKQNKDIDKILTDYKLQEYWETLRKRLNNYVHSNGTRFSIQNVVSADNKYLETHLKNITIRASYTLSFFFVVLLMTESSLISSTDYLDYLDCNMEPPEGSQYFIATFIQDFIDTKIAKLHPELKQFLKDNNNHGMKID